MNPKDAIGLTKPQLHLVPPALQLHAATAMADGAKKYGPYNWRSNPVLLTVYLDAIARHGFALLDGEDRARDSGHLHLAHMAADLGIILDALEGGNLIDDRPHPGPAADIIESLTRPVAQPIPSVSEETSGTFDITMKCGDIETILKDCSFTGLTPPSPASPYRERKVPRYEFTDDDADEPIPYRPADGDPDELTFDCGAV